MMRTLLFLLASTLSTAAPAADPAAGDPHLPGDSLYHLDLALTGQDGREFRLDTLRGQPVLVAMFYTSCRYICPLVIDSMRGVEQALDEGERTGLRILLVSLDPDRDDPAALGEVARRRRLDPARWILARTETHAVRQLAAVLGVRYRALADGGFNHISELVLLDRDGRPLARTPAAGPVPAEDFLLAVRAALGPVPPPPAD